ncbi:type I-E CRISPR-associated endoribonuclease Cas2e [Lacticaseibacillus parakribbianus]|uniref:type I-E CRISPR-associated endoribonuclease Cas2e n=1 Tax=Lacticaseibacillus parakribbianus TaxID=2970927 RepID=UPI0021CB58A9|nr:type I-E CRISPR-associated endoribonuclease Cas2e [Lacticaseibacillus parakribbianus]
MIVVTLSKVPPALRGVLTRWYQEVQTGVYVGSVSARVRDQLWVRITRDIGSGEATMVYSARNELGYQFVTTRRDRQLVDYDGVPLMMRLAAPEAPVVKPGFSDAAHFHQAKMLGARNRRVADSAAKAGPFVTLDLETSGLVPGEDQIIAIGAVRLGADGTTTAFSRLIAADTPLSPMIRQLTGLTESKLKAKGVGLGAALADLRDFIGVNPIVGYNLPFDDKFLAAACRMLGIPPFDGRRVDLTPVVKRHDKFLDNYKLGTVLAKYGIENAHPHDALADAEATMALAKKLIETGRLKL